MLIPDQREPLATTFRCVFCNHEAGVSVKIDKKAGVGNLSCKSCGQNFQTGINCASMCSFPNSATATNRVVDLDQPVDVYSEWVDACDAVARDEVTATTTATRPLLNTQLSSQVPNRAELAPGEKMTADDERFIDDDEDDAEAEYGDD